MFTKGILGRIVDAVGADSVAFKTAAYSLAGNAKYLDGNTPVEFLSAGGGAVRYKEYSELGEEIEDICKPVVNSIYGATLALGPSLLLSNIFYHQQDRFASGS